MKLSSYQEEVGQGDLDKEDGVEQEGQDVDADKVDDEVAHGLLLALILSLLEFCDQ